MKTNKDQNIILDLFNQEISKEFPLFKLSTNEDKLNIFFNSRKITFSDDIWEKTFQDIALYKKLKNLIFKYYVGPGKKFKNKETARYFFKKNPKKEAILRTIESYIREEELSPSLMGEYHHLNNQNRVLEAYERFNPRAAAFNREIDAIRKLSTQEFVNSKVSPEIRRFLNKKFNFKIAYPQSSGSAHPCMDLNLSTSKVNELKKDSWEWFLRYLVANHLQYNGFFENISKTLAEYWVLRDTDFFTIVPVFLLPGDGKEELGAFKIVRESAFRKNLKTAILFMFSLSEKLSGYYTNLPLGESLLESPRKGDEKEFYSFSPGFSERNLVIFRNCHLIGADGSVNSLGLECDFTLFSSSAVQDIHHQKRYSQGEKKYLKYFNSPRQFSITPGYDFKMSRLFALGKYKEVFDRSYMSFRSWGDWVESRSYVRGIYREQDITVAEVRNILRQDLKNVQIEEMEIRKESGIIDKMAKIIWPEDY